MQDDSGRRLRGVSGHIRTQCGDSKVWAVIHKSPVLESKRDVPQEPVVNASPVYECGTRLLWYSRNESACVASRIKHKRSRSCEHIGPQLGDINWNVDDQCSRRLMNVGLDAEVSAGSEIQLSVAIVAIAGFRSQPIIEMISIVD